MPKNATWLAYCPKNADCQAGEKCSEESIEIGIGIPAVRGRVEGHLVTWHPSCWLDAGIQVILSKPFNGRGPGRRPLEISQEAKVGRKLILNRYAAHKQKILKAQARLIGFDETEPEFDMLMLQVQAQELHQEKVWWEIQDYGGAPDTWRIPDGGQRFLTDKMQEK